MIIYAKGLMMPRVQDDTERLEPFTYLGMSTVPEEG